MDVRDASVCITAEFLLELRESQIAKSFAKSNDCGLTDKALARNLGRAHGSKSMRVLDDQFPHSFLGWCQGIQCGHDLVKHLLSFVRLGQRRCRRHCWAMNGSSVINLIFCLASRQDHISSHATDAWSLFHARAPRVAVACFVHGSDQANQFNTILAHQVKINALN
jgi:hypothetical protein